MDKNTGAAEKYVLKADNWTLSNINDADTAACLLLGLEPKSFFANTPPENCKANYKKFIWSHYWRARGIDDIYNHHQKIKKIGLWDNNFNAFAQRVYEAGYVFRDDVTAFLDNIGINLEYSRENKLRQKYEFWFQKRKFWTLAEIILLFKGYDPDKNGKQMFFDFRQNSFDLGLPVAIKKNGILIEWDDSKIYVAAEGAVDGYVYLKKEIERRIGSEKNGNYRPQEIIKAIQEITGYQPVPILNKVFVSKNALQNLRKKSVTTHSFRKIEKIYLGSGFID